MYFCPDAVKNKKSLRAAPGLFFGFLLCFPLTFQSASDLDFWRAARAHPHPHPPTHPHTHARTRTYSHTQFRAPDHKQMRPTRAATSVLSLHLRRVERSSSSVVSLCGIGIQTPVGRLPLMRAPRGAPTIHMRLRAEETHQSRVYNLGSVASSLFYRLSGPYCRPLPLPIRRRLLRHRRTIHTHTQFSSKAQTEPVQSFSSKLKSNKQTLLEKKRPALGTKEDFSWSCVRKVKQN